MRPQFNIFQAEIRGTTEQQNVSRTAQRTDLSWGRSMFKPPALQNPKIRIEDLSFAMGFRSKDRVRS